MATTIPLQNQVKLGELPVGPTSARSHSRTVRPAVLPPPPPTLDLAAPVPDWPMYANDRLGDCTTAAAGHMIEAWTAASRGRGRGVRARGRERVRAREGRRPADQARRPPFNARRPQVLAARASRATGSARSPASRSTTTRSCAPARTCSAGLHRGSSSPRPRSASSSGTGPNSSAGQRGPADRAGTPSTSSATTRAR